MFAFITNSWKKYGYEIIIIICFIAIGFLALFNIGKKGTWSTNYYIPSKVTPQPIIHHTSKKSKGETECKQVLERIFNVPFKTTRPDFLKNPVTLHYNLELDCYNESLRLAIEYNGEQHYKYIPYFHRNKESFMNQCYRDELKRRMCKENNVNLIEVPYYIKLQDIESYLLNKLHKLQYI